MSVFTDIWRQLVRRRLWPVALLLVAAIAAVPVVLAKEPEPAPPAPLPTAGAAGVKAALTTEPIVALAGPEAPDEDRVPLGKRHDIFKPTKKAPKAEKADETPSANVDTGPTKPESSGGGTSKAPSGGGGTTPAPTVPEPETEPEQPKTYPLYSLVVRFGDDAAPKQTLPKLSPLPSAETPLLVYLGLADRNKSAVFMVDATIKPQGDGECHPTPENCETLHMREGDTEFFDGIDADGNSTGDGFQLDLLKINKGKTTDAEKATRSSKLAKVSKAATLGRTLQAGFGDEALRRFGVVGRTR